MADKKENAKDAEERRREAQIRQASAELMYLGCLLLRMALERFCCLHRGDQFEPRGTDTPQATSDVGTCLSGMGEGFTLINQRLGF